MQKLYVTGAPSTSRASRISRALHQTWLLCRLLGVLYILSFSTDTQALQTQGFLDNPSPASIQSGIGIIAGWVCEADDITIEIDNGPPLHAAHGTTRADTAPVCGDTENGFGLTFNWSLLGAGLHTLRVLVDGNELSSVAFEVITLGTGEFQRGLIGQSSVINFPTPGQMVQVQWEESLQNFVIGGNNTNPEDSDSYVFQPRMALENPQPASSHSGIGIISGWACEAQNITIQIDETSPLRVAHGTTRADTFPICGDDRNGFGLPFNWNLLVDGLHTLSVYADGVKFSEVTFRTTTLGLGEFPRDLDDTLGAIVNFPARGTEVRIRWQESLQNFVLDSVLSPGLDDNLCGSQEGVVTSNDGQEADIEVTNSCGQEDGQEDITLGLDGNFPIQNGSKNISTTQEISSQNAIFKKTVASQASSFDELLAELLADNATFLLCADEFLFWQEQTLFHAEDFQILDGQGQEIVCRDFQQGERLQALISVREGASLNFGTDFILYYRNSFVAAFLAPPPESPILALSVPIISFGNVPLQHSGEAHITIQNKGIGVLSGKASANAPFHIMSGDTFHSLTSEQTFTLAAGEEHTLAVQFRPLLKGVSVGSLDISSNSGTAEVHLNGNVP